MRPSPRQPQLGLTLVELLVTLTIAAILLTVAAPSFTAFINNQKLNTVVREFHSDLALTRSEAIKRGSRVDMVAKDQDSWNSGWDIFIDNDGNLKYSDGDQLISQHDPLPANILTTSTFVDSSITYVSYGGSGRSRVNTSPQQPQNGTVSFKLGDDTVRRVKINFLGRIRICNPSIDIKNCDDNVKGS